MSVILHIFHCACAKRPYFHSRSKSDVTVVFLDSDFVKDAQILAIRVGPTFKADNYRIINICMDFQSL